MIHQHKARVYIQTTVRLQKSRCLASFCYTYYHPCTLWYAQL